MGRCATPTEGWYGWDAYAPFYDWENGRTQGRRDVRFWVDLARRAGGPVLELGCGTGRLSLPVARAAAGFVGVDRSMPMLRQLRAKLRRSRLSSRASVTQGDIRALPFRRRWRCALVMAPYGMLQSLLTDDDLDAGLAAAARVLPPGGKLGIDLAAGLARWREYDREVSLRGSMSGGRRVTLIESVRQVPRRGLTVFDQEFIEWRDNRRRVSPLLDRVSDGDRAAAGEPARTGGLHRRRGAGGLPGRGVVAGCGRVGDHRAAPRARPRLNRRARSKSPW